MSTTSSILTTLVPATLVAGVVMVSSLAGGVCAQVGSGVMPLRYDDATARFVDERGRGMILRGVNLGNWFLLEPWMLGLDSSAYRDQHDILMTLESRFGAVAAESLLDTYRANWITERELAQAKAFGFNVVRLPFHYSLVLDYERPYGMREDAFRWLDHAIKLCEDQGLYVILDLHGAPGGQSHDMPSGRVGENALWTDEVAQRQMVALWRAVAERYAGRASVVGYDLVNEPWGDFQQDLREDIVRLVNRLHDAVREVDPETVIYAPGLLNGVLFYGDPRERGWTNTGYTIHTYPGLFGNGEPTLATHQQFLEKEMPALAAAVARVRVPVLVGEFNPVFAEVDRPAMLRRHFDVFAELGWHATVWSLRKINPEGGLGASDWCLLTNAEPFRLPDPATATAVELDEAFEQLGRQRLAVDPYLVAEPLVAAYDDGNREAVAEAAWPSDAAPAGWSMTAVGNGAKAGLGVDGEGKSFTVHALGQDIWGGSDAFAYLSRPVAGLDEVSVVVEGFDSPGRYGKAGVMLRGSEGVDAAHVLVHIFRDGRVLLAQRDRDGGPTREQVVGFGGMPVGLAVRRDGERVSWRVGYPETGWGAWQVVDGEGFAADARIGVAVSSNAEAGRAALRARFGDELGSGAPAGERVDLGSGSWGSWGEGFEFLSDSDSLVYRPDGGGAGMFRDVSGLGEGVVTLRMGLRGLEGLTGEGTVELRLESVGEEGRLLRISSRNYAVSDLKAAAVVNQTWLTGPQRRDTVRALVVVDGVTGVAGAPGARLIFENPELVWSPARGW
ncbi:MAG: cellulase family glycosylhydrolase [Phycisphaeraceae bacterium]